MDAEEARNRGIQPLGFYRGMVVRGCDPGEMGIGPVFAVEKYVVMTMCIGGGMGAAGLFEVNLN